MMDKEQEQENSLFILGEVFSDYAQGISFAQGGPAFDSIETASLDFTEQPYQQSRTGVPQGFQDGGDVGGPSEDTEISPIFIPDGGDSDAAGGGIDTGTNTVAGTIAALGVAAIALSNASLSVIAGKLGKAAITGQPATPNVAPLSMQIAAMEDATVASENQSSEDALADIEAAEAEFGKGTSSVFAGAPASGLGTTGAIGGTVGSAYGDLGEQSDDTGPAGTPQGLSQDDPSETGFGYSGHGSGGAMSDTGNISAAADAASIGVSAGPSAGSGDTGEAGAAAAGEGVGGGWKHGGQIKGYQEGDLVEDDQADTQLDDLGLGPIGIVNDTDGTTGVADDLEMDLPDKSYVLNAEAVRIAGIGPINTMIKKAIDLAIEDGVDLPSEIKTAEKVPIRISKGEAALPHPLGMYIGEGKLEKMNARGLRAREQRESEEAPVQMAAAPSPQEDLLAQIKPVA